MDQEQTKLSPGFAARWPQLDGIPWFPALGDGACDNVGSGCTKRDRYALMVGTSGAIRASERADSITIPSGLFCYRLDRKRFVLGGALSNGGEVFAWMRKTLQLPPADELNGSWPSFPRTCTESRCCRCSQASALQDGAWMHEQPSRAWPPAR